MTAVLVLLVLGIVVDAFVALGGIGSLLAMSASGPVASLGPEVAATVAGLRVLAIGTAVIALVDLVVLLGLCRPLQRAAPVGRAGITARPVVLAVALAVLLASSGSPGGLALVAMVPVLLFGSLMPALLWFPASSRRYFDGPPASGDLPDDAPTVTLRLPAGGGRQWVPVAVVVVVLLLLGVGAVGFARQDRTVPATAADAAGQAVRPASLPTRVGGTGTIPIGSAGVQAVAVSPRGDLLVVGTYPPVPGNGSATPGLLAVVDTATGTVRSTIPVGKGLLGLAISPDGNRVYATMSIDDVVEVIDLPGGRVVERIPTGGHPQGIAMSPDGRTVWVANYSDGTLVAVDTAANGARASLLVGEDPTEVSMSADGRTVTVGRQGGLTVVDTVTLVGRRLDLGTGTQVSAIAGPPNGASTYVGVYGGSPDAVLDVPRSGRRNGSLPLDARPRALAATTGLLVVGSQEPGQNTPGMVQFVDTDTMTTRLTVPVRGAPSSIAISPDRTSAFIAHDGEEVAVVRLRDR